MVSADVVGSGEAQGNLNSKVNEAAAPSFKETLIGRSDKPRGVNPIAELDVEVMDEDDRIGGAINRRRRNFTKQGPSGENGGIFTAREARGSRFAALSSAMSDGIERVVEPILVDEEHGYQADHVTEKRVSVVSELGASTSAGIAAGAQHRNQVGQDKSIGVIVLAEKEIELVGQVSSGVQIGSMKTRSGEDKSVASKETVTQMPSSLNSAKHAAI
ncbi:hypothetical protein V6N11_038618 [Hibiscus sabdariffa]|uniref:Uncharacterized protein n=1 Tax=Hibiscus sabdariffa TaxID=183260 RepID=A0ABR2SL71_9ROSI